MKKINKNMFYMDTKNSRQQSMSFLKAVKHYKSIQGYEQDLKSIIKEYLS